MVDEKGDLVKFTVRPGNVAEVKELDALLDDVSTGELIADKAYDSNAVRLTLAARGIVATIPSRSNRKAPAPFDTERYKTRHLVENFFADLKQFRGVATRYCKLADRYRAFVSLAGWLLLTKETAMGS